MNTLRKVMNKVTSIEKEEVQLESHKVDLALLDTLSDINMEAGSLLTLQKQQMEASEKLDKSIALNKKGLAEAQKSLKAAQDLGVQDAVETFKRWIKSFSDDIARAEKGKKLVAGLSNF